MDYQFLAGIGGRILRRLHVCPRCRHEPSLFAPGVAAEGNAPARERVEDEPLGPGIAPALNGLGDGTGRAKARRYAKGKGAVARVGYLRALLVAPRPKPTHRQAISG